MTTAAELIAALRSEATPLDAGSFTIDPEEAARRFARFRYADLDAYLVPIAEGLRVLGATGVLEVETDGADVSLRAPEVDVPEARRHFRELYASPFGDLRDPVRLGMSRIAVGVDMALARDGVREVAIAYRGRTGSCLAIVRRGQALEIRALDDVTSTSALSVVVDAGLASELSAVVEDAHGSAFDRLRRSLRVASGSVTINGHEAVGGPPTLSRPAALEMPDLGTRGTVGWRTGDPHASLVVLSAGVVIDEVPLPEAEHGFVAFVELPGAARDLSQFAVVRDARFDAVREAVLDASRRAGAPPAADEAVAPAEVGPSRARSWTGVALLVAVAAIVSGTAAMRGVLRGDPSWGWVTLDATYAYERGGSRGDGRDTSAFYFSFRGREYVDGRARRPDFEAPVLVNPVRRRVTIQVDPRDLGRIVVDTRPPSRGWAVRGIAAVAMALAAPLMARRRELSTPDRDVRTRLTHALLLVTASVVAVAVIAWALA